MKSTRFFLAMLCFAVCGRAPAQVQSIDKELSSLAEKLAPQIKAKSQQKVAVIDFTDFRGRTNDLGKYIAEQLTVNLVLGKYEFAVLDRANLKRILAEHKLTSTGLVDPDNARKFGMFAGVDALVMGTYIVKDNRVDLTATMSTTETAESVGAGRAEFRLDDTVQQLLSANYARPKVINYHHEVGETKEGVKATKTFGDLRIDVESLTIVNKSQFLLTITVTNQNKKKSIWLALHQNQGGTSHPFKASLIDSESSDYQIAPDSVSGLAGADVDIRSASGISGQATEIKGGESLSLTAKFAPSLQKEAPTGDCRLQLEFISFTQSHDKFGAANTHNFVAKVKVN